MDMGVATIAATTVSFVSKYLAKGAESVVAKIGEDLYKILKSHFGNSPEAGDPLKGLEGKPADPGAQESARLDLEKLLAKDESLAKRLGERLVSAAKTEDGATAIQQFAGTEPPTGLKPVGSTVGSKPD